MNVDSALTNTTQEQREKLAKELKEAGKFVIDVPTLGDKEISKDLIAIEYKTRTENHREYVPNVIEPSFGIGRIFFALCEHNFWTRAEGGGDEARGVSLPSWVSFSQDSKLTNPGPFIPSHNVTNKGPYYTNFVKQGVLAIAQQLVPEAQGCPSFFPCRFIKHKYREALLPKR